ncbi:fibronectin type III domain-containing protein [Candidatus Roizmanbacteria bacterium]|nr:fibronectin type III domain-containing protein [Candidatus Roizmanbacteria bacterium]
MHHKKNIVIIISLVLLFFIFIPLPTHADSTPDKDHSDLSVSSSVPADGQTTAIVTVTLRDSSGNPINGHLVTLSDSSNSGVTISSILGTTDVNGHALFSIKSSTPQTDNLDVTDTTANIKFFTLGKITFTIAGCSDSPPGGTPQLLSAVARGSNQIVLSWTTASNPVSNYLVSYGLTSGQYIYGNPNVGGQGTTSYTVGSLTPGQKYYFVVKAVNGCTPGNFSNEISTTAGGIVTVNTPTPEQIPTIEITQKLDSQNNIVPTNIQNQSSVISSDTPIPSVIISQTQNSTSDESKPMVLLFISIGVVIIGSIGNFLYWGHEKKLQESRSGNEANQRF